MRPFDICGDLPTGTTVLEASAGTGKTYTVGALVTRYVAEGHATLEQLLVVTFGRAASQELRERVRGQLVVVERGLVDPVAARASSDQLLTLLAEASDDEVALRRRRVATALADFDSATIATTHQFCQQVLAGLGVAGDTEPGATLVEDLDDLVIEVVDDLYVRAFARADAGLPIFSRAEALELARSAVGNPQARLEPADADPGSDHERRRRFAEAVRTEMDIRKRRRGLLGFDDLLSRLATALVADDAAARARMRTRWKVVLVDEFQDTDPVQWQVLERAFAGVATLVLIGDPKQAIYAFRGGDVTTYLAAALTATTRATLARNWRSDAPLVAALQAMIGNAQLGDPDIVVRPVEAEHVTGRLVGAPVASPLRLRVVTRYQMGVSARGSIRVAEARQHVADDLAADIARLLGSGATFCERPLVAGDVAILVATHAQATLARNALADRRIPAVIAGSGSVFATPAADDWLILLEALEQPHRAPRVRAAALTPFLGLSATELASAGDELTDRLGGTMRAWADLLTHRGVAALLEVTTDQGLMQRLLVEVNGERRLTDLRHVGQALHAAAVEEGLGLAALVEWLRRRRAEAQGDQSADRTRRLDSDAAAVQVVTLHASKGLQYPVVYLPFAFDRWVPDPDVLLLHDADGQRVLDVGGSGSAGRAQREARAASEQAGEALRLLYVGLTRSQSHVVTWWAPTTNTQDAGLHRLLFGRLAGAGSVPERTPLPSDKDAAALLAELAARGGPVVEESVIERATRAPTHSTDPLTMRVAVFDRELDTAWRRLSYSALVAAGNHTAHPGVGSEPETGEREDEAIPVVPVLADGDAALLAVPSPMADLPAGTSFGTLVHAILETTNPQAADLLEELRTRCGEQLARRPVAVSADALASALLPVLETPLGPIGAGIALRDVPVRDRLTELDFELPLAGGDRPVDGATLAAVAPLLRRHLPRGDPLASYADRLADPDVGWQSLRGYLTGSLDAVLRLPGPTYVVADYKTNWLGTDAEPLTAWHYRPTALDDVMARSDYPLQALLYCVALHRFLRWRQPGYDAERHLGGVLYLYVRGMVGSQTPIVDGKPCGVFGWRPPARLVEDLSTLLDRGAA